MVSHNSPILYKKYQTRQDKYADFRDERLTVVEDSAQMSILQTMSFHSIKLH